MEDGGTVVYLLGHAEQRLRPLAVRPPEVQSVLQDVVGHRVVGCHAVHGRPEG
ncbi:hypothetical protein ACFYY8_41945 [Streptosporangium sp. NPDC001559]|uniref:hypothetical protein n=1 Tax=Streptosporangium sp. NPDC001559 TaxID=3366187 RepID=UPI0036F07E84